MSTKDFNDTVKRNVAENFDQSIRIYQEFEEKHGFFKDLALKMAETIDIEAHSSVLDVGCGYGISAKALNEQFSCTVFEACALTKNQPFKMRPHAHTL